MTDFFIDKYQQTSEKEKYECLKQCNLGIYPDQ